jgi:hypothetical protein
VVGEHKPKCRIAVQEFRVRKYALGLRIGLESRLGLALTLNLNFGSVILHLSHNFKKQRGGTRKDLNKSHSILLYLLTLQK